MTERWGITEMTDEELIDLWERTIRGVADGSLKTFSDREAFLADCRCRFGTGSK